MCLGKIAVIFLPTFYKYGTEVGLAQCDSLNKRTACEGFLKSCP